MANLGTTARLLATAALVTAAVAANAQRAKGTWTLQPKMGLSIGTFAGDYPACLSPEGDFHPYTLEATATAGIVAGAELEYQFHPMVSLAAAVQFAVQGGAWDDLIHKDRSGRIVGRQTGNRLRLDYVNLPIVAHLYLVRGLAVKAGIQPGILIGSKEERTISHDDNLGQPCTECSKSDAMDAARNIVLSIPVGASYEYRNMVLDARYNIGLTKVGRGVDISNNVAQFTLGYRFDLF
jgi:hypothetical protein